MTHADEDKKREPWTTTLGVWVPTVFQLFGFVFLWGMMKADTENLKEAFFGFREEVRAEIIEIRRESYSINTRVSTLEGRGRGQ